MKTTDHFLVQFLFLAQTADVTIFWNVIEICAVVLYTYCREKIKVEWRICPYIGLCCRRPVKPS